MSENPYEPSDSINAVGTVKSNPFARFFKRVLQVLGGIVLLFIILGIIASLVSPSNQDVDQDVEALTTQLLPLLASNDYSVIEPHLSAEIMQNVTEEKMKKLLKLFAKLGRYKSHQAPQRQNCRSMAGTETYTMCDYVVTAQYDHEASINLTAIKFKDQPAKIYHLKVNSDVFME